MAPQSVRQTLKRVICFTAFRANLRATAFTKRLPSLGFEVRHGVCAGPAGTVWELLLTLLPNCWIALTCRADLAVGFKPHLNVALPLLLCKLRGIRTWIDVDDLDHAYREGFVSKLVEWCQRPFPRRFDVVSFHHRKLRDFLVDDLRCDGRRLVRIPQGVDSATFQRAVRPEEIDAVRSRLGLAPGPLGMYTAHLNVASDLAPVLKIWSRVVRRMPEARLLVVGGGPMLQCYCREVARMGLGKCVVFTGQVPHSEVRVYAAFVRVALLYFSPRRVNGYRCSLKLREYFAAGIPVVCNDYGELPEFEDYTYGGSSDFEKLAETVFDVMDGRSDGREQRARTMASERLDWDRLVAQGVSEIRQRLEG